MTKLIVAFRSFAKKNRCNNWGNWDRTVITCREILMDIRTLSTVNAACIQALMDRNFTSTKTEITRRLPIHTLQVLVLFPWGALNTHCPYECNITADRRCDLYRM